MHLYRQSIIIFGAVLPVLIATIFAGIGFIMKSKMISSFDNKVANYKTFLQTNRETRAIETQVVNQRTHLERWKQQLSEETSSAVTSNLRQISEKLPSKEIQQTAFERPSGSGGFGAASAQKSSQIRIAFRGTYRTLQSAFFGLETRMPQLQLQEIKIEPIATSPSLMNLQVTYTAWEN
jgi:hypothetical protein